MHDHDGWRSYGLRGLPHFSGRDRVPLVPPLSLMIDDRLSGMSDPFVGITTDGTLQTGLRTLDGDKVSTQAITDAALAFLQSLTPEQRDRASLPIDAGDWRTWCNIHVNLFRHGVLLDDLSPAQRDLALMVLRATLSAEGYEYATGIMKLNELAAEIVDHDQYGQWLYFLSIFGAPGSDEPWGWQIDGHHLCINTMVFDGHVSTTPTFFGSEPRSVGDYSLFDPEEEAGVMLIRALDDGQRGKAIIHPSIHPDDLPQLQHPFDGRQAGGCGHDNAVIPYQGVSAADMTDAQRNLLLAVASSYVGWSADEPAKVKMTEVRSHLDDTWFSWYGGYGDSDAFYYRVHSPVVLIEFDHHPGVIFDNDAPARHHIHMLVRTPNGGDYGRDLLAEHHEQFDHSSGQHVAR
ncbi:MAG TPA: DUF3500 domain-containing protein [Acidimicrobiales bacterium]|nr:DUF3500 domain-containing protein [Acidimicrobiales bacterium]